ncbi:hypothetical protein MD484_g1528, partial [Candolleomyces efflorescens]
MSALTAEDAMQDEYGIMPPYFHLFALSLYNKVQGKADMTGKGKLSGFGKAGPLLNDTGRLDSRPDPDAPIPETMGMSRLAALRAPGSPGPKGTRPPVQFAPKIPEAQRISLKMALRGDKTPMSPGASTKRKHADENLGEDSRKKSKASEHSSQESDPSCSPPSSSNESDPKSEKREPQSPPVTVKTEKTAPILNDRDINSGPSTTSPSTLEEKAESIPNVAVKNEKEPPVTPDEAVDPPQSSTVDGRAKGKQKATVLDEADDTSAPSIENASSTVDTTDQSRIVNEVPPLTSKFYRRTPKAPNYLVRPGSKRNTVILQNRDFPEEQWELEFGFGASGIMLTKVTLIPAPRFVSSPLQIEECSSTRSRHPIVASSGIAGPSAPTVIKKSTEEDGKPSKKSSLAGTANAEGAEGWPLPSPSEK